MADRDVVGHRVQDALRRARIGCVAYVDSVEALASQTEEKRLAVLVLGVTVGRAQCLTAFSTARSLFPNTPIVGIWPDDQRRDDQRALRTGIDALLLEAQIEDALAATIHATCAGLICSPRTVSALVDSEALSSREKQVLGMAIMGFSNSEIGRRLYLAESTVKSHVSSAYMKLGVRSRKDAAALILDPHDGLGTSILAIQGT